MKYYLYKKYEGINELDQAPTPLPENEEKKNHD